MYAEIGDRTTSLILNLGPGIPIRRVVIRNSLNLLRCRTAPSKDPAWTTRRNQAITARFFESAGSPCCSYSLPIDRLHHNPGTDPRHCMWSLMTPAASNHSARKAGPGEIGGPAPVRSSLPVGRPVPRAGPLLRRRIQKKVSRISGGFPPPFD